MKNKKQYKNKERSLFQVDKDSDKVFMNLLDNDEEFSKNFLNDIEKAKKLDFS